MEKTLTGEVALVTGAAGRLGPVWVRALAEAGATVIGVDRDDATDLDDFIQADISDPDQVADLVSGLGLDVTILVNNAGVDSRPSSQDYEDMAQDMLRVNVWGTDLMTRTFAPAMCERGHGTIINISSLYGLCVPDLRYYSHRQDGWVKDPMYGATKAAINSLTRYYAAKYGPDGVRVNALSPGGVVAPGDGLTAQDPDFVAKYTSRIPMGRMATPDDLGGALVFLASKASSFVTGQVLAIDGGYLCW